MVFLPSRTVSLLAALLFAGAIASQEEVQVDGTYRPGAGALKAGTCGSGPALHTLFEITGDEVRFERSVTWGSDRSAFRFDGQLREVGERSFAVSWEPPLPKGPDARWAGTTGVAVVGPTLHLVSHGAYDYLLTDKAAVAFANAWVVGRGEDPPGVSIYSRARHREQVLAGLVRKVRAEPLADDELVLPPALERCFPDGPCTATVEAVVARIHHEGTGGVPLKFVVALDPGESGRRLVDGHLLYCENSERVLAGRVTWIDGGLHAVFVGSDEALMDRLLHPGRLLTTEPELMGGFPGIIFWLSGV